MNKLVSVAIFAAVAAAAAAGSAKSGQARPPADTVGAARIDAKTGDKTRDPGLFGEYWWANRFMSRRREADKYQGRTVDVAMVGDSIIHFWEWKHPQSWAKFTEGRTAINLGYGGDRTQHVIWRIEHGELDGYKAKNVVVMIGTNNNSPGNANPTNVFKGVEKIVKLVKARQPEARIILHPIFPRGCSPEPSKGHAAAQKRNEITNSLLKEYAAAHPELVWVDFNAKLVDESGWVPRRLMPDEVHPSDEGYDIWMQALLPNLAR
ncbi:MAG: hypothetical protein IJI35_13440 [Kiritimatiellae bacterium]|nr:hypothetical protein [Kiritimatiellia bacterium]